MDLSTAEKLFDSTDQEQFDIAAKYDLGMRYYRNVNDIVKRGNGDSKIENNGNDEDSTGLRKANSHVSNNYHQPIVDQKVSYVLGQTPDIDTEDDSLNEVIKETLGERFGKTLQQLATDASNAGVGWLHVWLDDLGKLNYTVIPPDQIVPIYDSNGFNGELQAIRRVYRQLDTETGTRYIINEYWTSSEGQMFRREEREGAPLEYYNRVPIFDTNLKQQVDSTNVVKHELGIVPFIPFVNNHLRTSDLIKYKGLIDVYDDIYNGFVNDVKDVQQVILILTNYSGESIAELMNDMKVNKALKFEDDGEGKSGLDKLQIDIPIEARNALLDETRKNIYTQGQAVDLDPERLDLGNSSGVALKMLYGNLELKAQKLESEFRIAIDTLIRALLNTLHVADWETRVITQTWTRSSIRNNSEQADMIAKLADITSDENIAKANPLVDDWHEELELLQKKREEGHDSYEV